MKYLKYFETEAGYTSFKNGSDYVLPNVSYVVETKGIGYAPKKAFKLQAKYNATPDNLVAFNGASNIKSMKVNGAPIKIEPIKNEITSFDVLGENISIDMETGAASFPESYLIKSPVSSWSFKAKDPNYVINENTFVCMFGMYDGEAWGDPVPLEEVMDYLYTTNDGVTLEVVGEFLDEINNEYIWYGEYIGFTLMDVDRNSGTFMFIDTEHQTNITTGGLPTYSFDSEGLYDVEIELADPVIRMQFAGSLISIKIGDGITFIGNYVFDSCTGLTSINIPDSVTSIGKGAFYNCKGLTSITIPNSVTSIGNYAFHNCTGLTSINIPDSVTSIGEGVFSYSGLTSINIPDSVTSIGDEAFLNCTELSEIICNAIIAPTIDSRTFYVVENDGVLKVPAGSDYSSWMSTDKYYLGYYNWTIQYI